MAHLVFQTAYPGDLFLSLPLIKRLRAFDPGTPIVLACRPGLGEVFLKNGLVDQVIEIDKRSRSGRKRALKQLTQNTWDLVLVPHESWRTGLWMLRVRARQAKIGFESWWNRLIFDRRVRRPSHLPDALRQLSLLAPVDARVAEAFATDEVQQFVSPLTRDASVNFADRAIPEWLDMRLPRKSPTPLPRRVFLAPGSVWATKRWRLDGFEEIARRATIAGFDVVLIGSPAEKDLCDAIAAKVPQADNRAGQTTLAGLVDVLSEGGVLVCNDSGAMHAAALAGLPTLAIFGPTTLDLGYRPWNSRARVVQTALDCRPCGKHGAKTCPIGTHACMTEVSPDRVWMELQNLLRAYSE